MILVKAQILELDIVKNLTLDGLRDTTYDATVGKILSKGKSISDDHFKLKPRGIVWVISREEFIIPENVTGLATLKTTWTHKGILALNLGIIDPGYHGSLATAIVNFSKNDFTVHKGAQFFRVMFHGHAPTRPDNKNITYDEYYRKIIDQTNSFSDTFLTIDTLVPEISAEVLKSPKWAVWTGIAAAVFGLTALMIGMAAIFAPLTWNIGSELSSNKIRIDLLEKEIILLKEK